MGKFIATFAAGSPNINIIIMFMSDVCIITFFVK